MKRNIVETAMGAVVLLVAAGFAFFFHTTAQLGGKDGYELKARFSKIDGLENGSAVKVSGVKVGRVLGFSLDPESYQAEVRLTIDNNVKLPRDTAAVIASAGLLDGKFLTLEPGADDDMLAAGDFIEYTQSTPGLEQLLGQVIFSMT
ncbi:MAG: outer membrane lipid asymmetry maintenance protein MlaD, partial [Bdellovibrionales bacterium]|nr:outer membrane lipid asymmetry maintenance protein MlaD [Bdellovibrionales bacterium]